MTGFWHRSLLSVCVYRPRLHLGPSSRKRELIQSSLTIRLFSRAYVTKQKHFARQDGRLSTLLYRSYKLFAFVFKNVSSDFDFNWSILNNILQNCDLLVSPTPLMFCLVYLRPFLGIPSRTGYGSAEVFQTNRLFPLHRELATNASIGGYYHAI